MLKLEVYTNYARLKISRPEVKNAINSELIEVFLNKLNKIEENKNIRVLLIEGENGVFSSGADLNWLKNINGMNEQEIYEDSLKFVELLDKINNFSIPIISIVDGVAIGGGAGIALSSDIIIGTKNTLFGISELYYGIVPVAIIPIVKQRIGETKAREYLITGERINADKALEIGMLNYLVDENKVEEIVEKLINKLASNAPKATKKVRELIRNIDTIDNPSQYIAKEITNLRLSKEGKEGITAFLEKRKANWHK